MMKNLLLDIRVAVRSLRREPLFAVTAILILAIGIGTVTVMFSALRGVVLQPLPYPEPDRLVWIASVTDTGRDNSSAALDYVDYREGCDAFASLGAHLLWRPGRVVETGGEPERVTTTSVSHNLLTTLGVAPSLGRGFSTEEEVLGGPRSVIVSFRYWQTRLGGDSGAIGRPLTVDGLSYEVIGVLPQGFDYPSGVDLWFPMQLGGRTESGRGNNNFRIIGRLAEGVSLEQAQEQMDAVAARISAEYPAAKGGWGVRLEPLHENLVGDVRPLMLLLSAATMLLLLIACGNLSSLFLARVIARRGDLAVRRSLGASRWAIAAHLLTDAFTISLAGAAVGIALAVFGIRLLRSAAAEALPRAGAIELDASVLAMAVAASIFSALVAGVVPAIEGSRSTLASVLRAGRHTTHGARTLRLRSALVAGQVALSLVLVLGSGLVVRSLIALHRVDPGFEPDGLLTLSVQMPTYRYDDRRQLGRTLHEIIDHLRAVPGVASAAAADGLPPFGGPYNGIHPEGRVPERQSDRTPGLRRIVSDDFVETLGIPLLAGRTLTAADTVDTQPVALLSRTLAMDLFGDPMPLGKVFVLPFSTPIHLEVVGIVGDVRDYGPASQGYPPFYMSSRQLSPPTMRFVVRTEGDPTALAPALRSAILEVEPGAAVYGIGTMKERMASATSSSDLGTFLLSVFAVVALALAAAGLYGVMTCFVTERQREIGIRSALGAAPQVILGWVVGRGAAIAAVGLALGAVLAFPASRLIRSLLFATSPTDIPALTGAALTLTVAVLAACAVPAVRAARSDPSTTLRAR